MIRKNDEILNFKQDKSRKKLPKINNKKEMMFSQLLYVFQLKHMMQLFLIRQFSK